MRPCTVRLCAVKRPGYQWLSGLNADLHVNGCVPFDQSPLVVGDVVVVHAVPAIEDGPVCGQLDHHVLSGVAARRLIHLCKQETLGYMDDVIESCLFDFTRHKVLF